MGEDAVVRSSLFASASARFGHSLGRRFGAARRRAVRHSAGRDGAVPACPRAGGRSRQIYGTIMICEHRSRVGADYADAACTARGTCHRE